MKCNDVKGDCDYCYNFLDWSWGIIQISFTCTQANMQIYMYIPCKILSSILQIKKLKKYILFTVFRATEWWRGSGPSAAVQLLCLLLVV